MTDAEWKADMITNLRIIFEDRVAGFGGTRSQKIESAINANPVTLEVLKMLMDSESTENASLQRAMMLLPFVNDAKRMKEIKDEMEHPTPIL